MSVLEKLELSATISTYSSSAPNVNPLKAALGMETYTFSTSPPEPDSIDSTIFQLRSIRVNEVVIPDAIVIVFVFDPV